MHELDEMCDDHYAELSEAYASEKSKALIIDPVQNAEALHRAAGKALEAAGDALNDANEENKDVARAAFDSAYKAADSAATEYIRTKNEAKAAKVVAEHSKPPPKLLTRLPPNTSVQKKLPKP